MKTHPSYEGHRGKLLMDKEALLKITSTSNNKKSEKLYQNNHAFVKQPQSLRIRTKPLYTNLQHQQHLYSNIKLSLLKEEKAK